MCKGKYSLRLQTHTHTRSYTYCSFKTLIYAVGTLPKAGPLYEGGIGGFSPERDGPVALAQVMQCADCTAPRRKRKRMEGGWKKMRESVGGTDVEGYVPH